MLNTYKKQVALLIKTIPLINEEPCFALHGGTAINLFVRDMPRLSVDIDLTYLPLENRSTTLENIRLALARIKQRIAETMPDAKVQHKEEIAKLMISTQSATIKLEVNLVGRGTISAPIKMPLCEQAQSEFEAFAGMQVVPVGQLYGGKICAALDRQHPRDLFDVKYLLEREGFTDEVKQGFLFCLLGSDRPINEVIMPNFHDHRKAMENQFTGMSEEIFTYEDFEKIREKLVKLIHKNLTDQDKEFLLSVKNTTPDWSIYDFKDFPAVQWKLQNLEKLKASNPVKHAKQYQALRNKLYP